MAIPPNKSQPTPKSLTLMRVDTSSFLRQQMNAEREMAVLIEKAKAEGYEVER